LFDNILDGTAKIEMTYGSLGWQGVEIRGFKAKHEYTAEEWMRLLGFGIAVSHPDNSNEIASVFSGASCVSGHVQLRA